MARGLLLLGRIRTVMRKRTPFERNWGLFSIGYSKKVDLGLYLRLNVSDWQRCCWGHPEADAIWYMIGPFAFFKIGIYS